MDLFVADYVLLALIAFFAVFGLFNGFSGGLAFLLGQVAAYFCGRFTWAPTGDFMTNVYLRGITVGIVALFAFFLTRMLVKRLVRGLVAQPADAIFGTILYAITGAVLGLGVISALHFGLKEIAPSSVFYEKALQLIGA